MWKQNHETSYLVKFHSFGCSSFVYYDTNYFVGFKKNWISLGSLKGFKNKKLFSVKKMSADDFSNYFIGINVVVFLFWNFSKNIENVILHFFKKSAIKK